jgi:hypothetical protein
VQKNQGNKNWQGHRSLLSASKHQKRQIRPIHPKRFECLVNTGVCEKFLHLVFKKYQISYNDPLTFQGAYKTEKFALPLWATKNLEITIRAAIEVGGFRNNHVEKIPSIKEVRAAVNLTTGSSRSLRSLGTG